MADVLQPPLANAFIEEDREVKEVEEVEEVEDKEEGEASPKPVKQIANGLDSVMVSGMLRNISDKVATKLKQESEEELVEIMVKRMEKEEEEEGSGVVSWEEWPTGNHLMTNPTAGRVKAGPKRPPSTTSRRRDGSEKSEEEDFDSLLAAMEGESEDTSMVEVEEDLDDVFDSLLKESTLETESEGAEEENLRKRSVDDDFNLLLEDNDIKEEELVEKVEIVSTDESSEEEDERGEVGEIGKGEVVAEAEVSVMNQEEDARADNKEGDAALEVTPAKCAANEGQAAAAAGESKNESGSKDPFDELFEELADGEIEAEEGFQQIFGQGGVEAVTGVVDTPTPQVVEEETSGEEAGEGSLEKMEQEATRMTEKETKDAFERAMEEEEELITMRRSEEKEMAFSKLLADQEESRKTPDLEEGGEGETGEGENLDSKPVIEEEVGEMADVGGPASDAQQNVKLMSSPSGGNEEKEKKVIEIEEVIDEGRVRELAEELAREVVERERGKHKEEVISMAREVVGEREVFTDRIDRLENEVEVLQGEVVSGQSEVERLLGVVEEQAAQLASAREEVKVLSGLRDEGPGEAGKRVVALERELEDQREVNAQLKAYVGEVLVNIMLKNPQILERKA